MEYPVELDSCPECGGSLTDAPAPERRIFAGAEATLVVVAVLPPEQALVASDRLDKGGIPSALRDAGGDGASMDPDAVRVLVPPAMLADARRVLRGRRARSRIGVMTYLMVVTAIAIFLSAVMVLVRWILTGSPLPR